MSVSAERAAILSFLFSALSACDGQFDFDTALLDAAEPPIGVPDASSTGDAAVDVPRAGLRIACGASECLSAGCCTGNTGTTCVDLAEGGTCNGLLIQCDDTEDCATGEVCCAEGDVLPWFACFGASDCNPNPRPQRVHCEPESHCRAMNFVILCNPYRPSPCAQCITTTLTGLPPGYHQCPAP
jgi:hypothetical protein